MRLAFICAMAGLMVSAVPALADVEVKLSFAYVAPDGLATVPSPELAVTDLLQDSPLTVLAPEVAPEGSSLRVVQLPEASFVNGRYARLRVAVKGLRLPPEDARAKDDLSFAFELILRRDTIADAVEIQIPVIVSSRKEAMKSLLSDPQIAEELPGRFFAAQQYMVAYRAEPEAVAAAPSRFAIQRLIARAMVDFSLDLTDQRQNGVQILPAPEMARDVALYWDADREGKKQHLRAYGDARSFLWQDLAEVETTLREARRAGVEAVGLCAKAQQVLDFFEGNPPPAEDARRVDLMFPNPGSLQGYLEGRRLDVLFICTRPKI